MIQRHPEDTSRIELLRHTTNARLQILHNAISENRNKINENIGANRDNFGNVQNTLDQHGARLSNLESSGGSGEEIVVPATGGI